MLSLHAKNKKKAPATKNGKSKGKLVVMNHDNNESEDGEDDNDEDVAAGEKKALSDLETEYRKCMCCGPTVMCKIDRTGDHVHLKFPQRRAWAVSLVRVNSFSGILIHRLIQACGTQKVTKITPPQSELFRLACSTRTVRDSGCVAIYKGILSPPNPFSAHMTRKTRT
jgi:hypothetical protein